jgi:hypothetical protein
VQGQICDILRPQLAMNRFLPLWPHRFPHFGYINLGGGGVGGALILDRYRAYDLFASVDAHLCFYPLLPPRRELNKVITSSLKTTFIIFFTKMYYTKRDCIKNEKKYRTTRVWDPNLFLLLFSCDNVLFTYVTYSCHRPAVKFTTICKDGEIFI